jgi:hypothetical protein
MVSSGLLRRVALVTAIKTSNLSESLRVHIGEGDTKDIETTGCKHALILSYLHFFLYIILFLQIHFRIVQRCHFLRAFVTMMLVLLLAIYIYVTALELKRVWCSNVMTKYTVPFPREYIRTIIYNSYF